MKTYNKLIRDKIPFIIRESGDDCVFHEARDNEEFEEKLFDKLQEEIGEFRDEPSVEEFADIMEVLEAIGHHFKIDLAQVKEVKISKKKERGGFRNKIILDMTKGGVVRDGSHVHINAGQKKLSKNFKTSGTK